MNAGKLTRGAMAAAVFFGAGWAMFAPATAQAAYQRQQPDRVEGWGRTRCLLGCNLNQGECQAGCGTDGGCHERCKASGKECRNHC